MRFFCDRLKDHHSIQPLVIYAFLALTSYQKVRNDQIITMLQSIFTEVHVQSLMQADRRNVHNILSNLLKTKLDVLRTLGADFVFGFIQCMDSERDPRNLLLCFNNSLHIIQNLDIKLFAEDFFEVLSCYFPVDFRERAEEEFRIKKKDLVSSLHDCLSATPLFGPYAVPLYLEKLSSDLMESKRDALLTFTACLKVYKPEDISVHIDDIWLSIRKDYLLSDLSELGDGYLEFIYELVTSLSQLEDESCMKKLVDFLVKDSLQTLKDPEMVIAVPCANVIYNISRGSHKVYQELVERLLTPLQTALEKYISPAQRTSVLEIVLKILSIDQKTSSNLILDFVSYLLPLFYDSLVNSDSVPLKVVCLKCLEEVVSQRSSYPAVDFDALSVHTFSVLDGDVPLVLLDAYKSFISKHSLNLPLMFTKHCLTATHKNTEVLKLLPFCSFENEELCKATFAKLNHLLSLACSGDNSCDIGDVLECYRGVLEGSRNIDGQLCFIPLFTLVASEGSSEDVIERVGDVLAVCSRLLSDEQCSEVCLLVSQLLVGATDKPTGQLFGSSLPTISVGDDSLRLSIVTKAVLTQVSIKHLQELNVESLFNRLVELLMHTHNKKVHENLAITLASITNKLPSSSQLTMQYLDRLKDSVRTGVADERSMVVLGWLTKALVLNWQSATKTSIDLMLECLTVDTLALQCCKSFGVVVEDCERVFTKKSHAVVKPVFKQRYTEYVVPLLIAQYNSCDKHRKSFHMGALSKTLQVMPPRMLQKHLKSMMPLLMHSLSTCTAQLREKTAQKHEATTPSEPQQQQVTGLTLKTICTVIEQSRDDVLDYVPTMISHLSQLISHSCMDVRINALKSLTALSMCTLHVILPLRTDVLKKVSVVLGDGKRLVRKEAVRCSNAWHMLNSPS